VDELLDRLRSAYPGGMSAGGQGYNRRMATSPANQPVLTSLDRVGAGVTIGGLVSAVASTAARMMIELAPALRGATGVVDVHQARVEVRRFRARTRALRPLLDRPWLEDADADMKWFGDLLGKVRDADVLSEDLERLAAALPELDFFAGRELLGGLRVERAAARSALVAAVDSDRYRDLVDRLLAAAVDPPLGAASSEDDPAEQVLPALLTKQWRRLCHDVAATTVDPSNGALHEARKGAKKLRYAAEMAEAAVGAPAHRLVKAGRRLQRILGEVHDAATAETWLRNRVLELDSLAAAVAAGELIARERAGYLDNRDRWPEAWRKARRQWKRARLKVS